MEFEYTSYIFISESDLVEMVKRVKKVNCLMMFFMTFQQGMMIAITITAL